MSPNSSVPDRRPSVITPLPARVEPGMTRRQKQIVFEQVKSQVLEVAIRHFDQSLRILRYWLSNER